MNTNIKRKERLKVKALEGNTTILSHQKRAFPRDTIAEAETETLVATKSGWRSGAGI